MQNRASHIPPINVQRWTFICPLRVSRLFRFHFSLKLTNIFLTWKNSSQFVLKYSQRAGLVFSLPKANIEIDCSLFVLCRLLSGEFCRTNFKAQIVNCLFPKFLCWSLKQCDQMTKLSFQWTFVQCHKCFQIMFNVFPIPNKPPKNSQILLKFCQIWSHWFQAFFLYYDVLNTWERQNECTLLTQKSVQMRICWEQLFLGFVC